MKDNEIHRLFESVSEGSAQNDAAAREVFSILVKATLKYRDRLLETEGITVTVEDVQIALNRLLPALATGEIPDTGHRISRDLLKLWLEELRTRRLPLHG